MTRELRADCASCFGLCCVAPAFAKSADFAIDKPAGTPCPNLLADFRCDIHETLRPQGFPGCAVFDCLGAGQRVAQHTYGGRDWRSHPDTAPEMFAVFAVMRQLHELLWYLTEARSRVPTLATEATAAIDEITAYDAPETLLRLDVAALRERVNPLLLRASETVRGKQGKDHRGADLVGAKLAKSDLRGANLRGALLIAADLRHADLREADLIGADLRAADLRGANLTGSIFLTQFQVNAAMGDTNTALPPTLDRPAHWRS